jgi:hypothetical protein
MNPVKVMLSGGLGNQMFQYAAGYALAAHLKTPLVLDVSSYRYDPLRDFSLGAFGIEEPETVAQADVQTYVTLNLKAKLKKILPDFMIKAMAFVYKNTLFKFLRRKQEKTHYVEKNFHFEKEFFDLKDGMVIAGRYQSENYFFNVQEEIHRIFTLKNPLSEAAQKILEQIQQTPIPVAIHVRRGDFLSAANINLHGAASLDYYKKAVGIINALYGKVRFFVFTDDTQYVRENFGFLQDYVLVSETVSDQHEDRFLMSRCRHNIIANSSFSWWGAWLNPALDKTVIAPRQWFSDEVMRKENIIDLYPKGWILL